MPAVGGGHSAGHGNHHTGRSAIEAPGPILAPGTATYPEGKTHIRDRVRRFIWVACDPRVDRTAEVVLNFNLDKDMKRPMWGTFSAVNGGPHRKGPGPAASTRFISRADTTAPHTAEETSKDFSSRRTAWIQGRPRPTARAACPPRREIDSPIRGLPHAAAGRAAPRRPPTPSSASGEGGFRRIPAVSPLPTLAHRRKRRPPREGRPPPPL
jgi:hypothetical protein